MDKEFQKQFLTNTDSTGRFIVKSLKTGKTYYVEPIDGNHTVWGDVDPATKKMTGDYGKKYKGSVSEEESMITENIGFDNIYTLKPGESPLDFIDRLENNGS